MRLAITAMVVSSLFLAGCGAYVHEPSSAKVNAACARHGGIRHFTREFDGENYHYELVCIDYKFVTVWP